MSTIRILSQQDVLSLMTVGDALAADELAYLEKAKGTGSVWPLVFHEFDPGKADLDIKSGDLSGSGVFGFKLVSWFGENAARGLPELFGSAMLFDINGGRPLALINAGALTGMRTGAAAAVGAKFLARADSESLLIVGTGMLAPYAAAAMLLAFPGLRSVTFVNPRNPGRAAEKLGEITRRVLELTAAEGVTPTAEFAAAEDIAGTAAAADIIVTATPAREPVLAREWIRPGTHISCLGADVSGKQELEGAILADAVVFADDRTQSVTVGECEMALRAGVISGEHIRGEIGELIAGTVPGRMSADEITVFDSSGIALQDLACCAALLRKAEERGIGLVTEF